MRYFKVGLLSCLMLLGGYISMLDKSYGYFEYRYYCDIQTNVRITISLKAETNTAKPCLEYIAILNKNISNYSQQISIGQEALAQGEYSDYRQSYLNEVQPKALQSRVLHGQILKAMNKFEVELFQKTMIYISYRYKSTRKSLESYVALRKTSITNAAESGASEDLQTIIQKYLVEKRKLEVLNLMFEATNFNELMPFYTMYKQGEFDY